MGIPWLCRPNCGRIQSILLPHYLINFVERCHRYGFSFYTWIEPQYVFWLRDGLLYLALGLSALYIFNAVGQKRRGAPVV